MKKIKEIVAAQIEHIETDFVPYTIDFDMVAQGRMNDYFGNDEWKSKILPCIKQIAGTFDSWDTMKQIEPDDPSKMIDAYGCIWINNGAISHLEQPILRDIPLHEYKWPTLDDFLIPEKLQRMQREASANPDQYKVAFAGAGHFELSWRLLGVEDALIKCIAEPDEYEEIIDRLDMLINQFVDACIKLPVDAVMLADDWCDQRSCTMGPERWRYFIKPRLARLYEKIHKAGKKTINHVCGSVTPLIPDLIEIGLDVLESVQPEALDMNPYELKRKFGKEIAFWGGLGCQSMVTYGSPADNQAEIRKLRKEMSVGGGYILAPSKDLNSTVPIENLLAIYETFIEENDKFGIL